jgi:transcriptional regulator with XRE-family HTH domain
MRPSRDLIIAVKLADRPAWRIAVEAGISPTTLSRLISGSLRPRPNDPRLLRVAEILGVPKDRVFAEVDARGQAPQFREGRA